MPLRSRRSKAKHGILAEQATRQRGSRSAESSSAKTRWLERTCHLGMLDQRRTETQVKAHNLSQQVTMSWIAPPIQRLAGKQLIRQHKISAAPNQQQVHDNVGRAFVSRRRKASGKVEISEESPLCSGSCLTLFALRGRGNIVANDLHEASLHAKPAPISAGKLKVCSPIGRSPGVSVCEE